MKAERMTTHHLSPRAICKVWGIPRRIVESPQNKEKLPWKIHQEQDKVIPFLLSRAVRQAKGDTVTLFEHHNDLLAYERGMK